MPKYVVYQLRINAYSPATIPMARLAQYLADLADLFGEASSVHLDRLKKGSTTVVARVDREAAPKVQARLESVGEDTAPINLTKAYTALDKRLADDNAIGTLSIEGVDKTLAEVIRFPGCDRPKPIDYGNVKEPGTLDGMPTGITGRDATKYITLLAGGSVYTNIQMSRELAIRITDAKCIFRRFIRLHGTGRWSRSDNGWDLVDYKADSFEVLEDASLRETVAELRAVEGSDWRTEPDPLSVLNELRGNADDSVH